MSYYCKQEHWLSIADKCKPELITINRRPISVVRCVKDPTKFQGWVMEHLSAPDTILDVLQGRSAEFVLDFGEHIVGSLQLKIGLGEFAADAPLRLHMIFAEVPSEIGEAFEPFMGELSRAWLQDEIINLDELPCIYTTPRRYAFRYLKIQIKNSSKHLQVKFLDIVCQTVTSANPSHLKLAIEKLPKEWQELDRISIRTLANCMQTVFEDGPKRDRRLWVGDLRLQAQANYETFNNNELVKRCLYLFAGLADTEGKVMADLYEKPLARKGNTYIMDYGALFPVILYDYLKNTADRQTAIDLWPVSLRQLDFITCCVNDSGLFIIPEKVWIFIDWCAPLHRQASMQAVLIYSLRKVIALAKEIGEEKSVYKLVEMVEKMKVYCKRFKLKVSSNIFEHLKIMS